MLKSCLKSFPEIIFMYLFLVTYLIETRNCVEIQLCTVSVQVPLTHQLARPVTSAAHIDLTYYTLTRHCYYF